MASSDETELDYDASMSRDKAFVTTEEILNRRNLSKFFLGTDSDSSLVDLRTSLE